MNPRTYELLLLRGKSLGRRSLALRSDGNEASAAARTVALAELGRAMLERPRAVEPLVEAAHIYAFSGDTTKAVEFYQTAITLMKELKLPKHDVTRLERRVEKLIAGTQQPLDSGDGAGLWRVEDITGVSKDTCIYHLRANPPGNPHPFPQSAWHIQVFLGSSVREYTPISSASAWEDGCLDLLVKTYPDGSVSRFFGTLRSVREAREAALQSYAPLEEQNCWVNVSAPLLTLDLPSFTAAPQLALIAGGTGIAPVVQIVAHCVAGGVLERCQVVLLYSSRTVEDILMLDELQRLESACCGRLQVFHTLTRRAGGARSTRTRLYFSGCHQHFRQEEEMVELPHAWEGHVDEEMMRKTLEMGFGTGKMTNATRIVVCGPQGLLDTVEACCLSLGEGESFSSEQLVLLQATKQSEPPILDSSEDDEVASVENVAIPMISISAPGAARIPAVSAEDPSSPSVPSTRKPGDLLKEQLGAQNHGMTFADRVRIEAAQKEGVCKGWSTFLVLKSLDSVLKNIGEAVAILVIYVFDVLVADSVSDFLPVHGKEFHISTCLMVMPPSRLTD
eukprot:s365_g13.t1